MSTMYSEIPRGGTAPLFDKRKDRFYHVWKVRASCRRKKVVGKQEKLNVNAHI